jgi:DNA-binding beta-propeller fold protein YncE
MVTRCAPVNRPLLAVPYRHARTPSVVVLAVATLALTAITATQPAAASPSPMRQTTAGSFGSALLATAPAPLPGTVAVNTRTNTIYVGNGYDPDSPLEGGHTVTVIDGRRCQAANAARCAGPWPTITVGNLPSTLAVDETTNTVYVTNNRDGTVSVIDGRTCNAEVRSGCGQTPPTVTVGTPDSATNGIAVDPRHHTVYAGNFNSTELAMIDTRNCNSARLHGCAGQHPPIVAVGPGPGDIDVNPLTHTAYVALLSAVAAFDTNTCNAGTQSGCGHIGTVSPDLSACGQFGDCGPFSAKVDVADNTIYASTGSANRVLVIDGRRCNASDLRGCAGFPAATIVIGPPGIEGTIWVAVDAAAHTVYVTNHKDDNLSVIDAATCNGRHLSACTTLVPPTIHTGTNPLAIAVNERTQTVYVGNEYDNTVAVIAAADCSATAAHGCRHPAPTVAAGFGPNAVTVDETVHTAYVTDGGGVDQGGPRAGNAVSMIDTKRCTARHPDRCAQTPPTVTVGTAPVALAIDPVTRTVYVANHGLGTSGSVSLINDRTCNAARHSGCVGVRNFATPNGIPTMIAVNSATKTVYVAVATPAGPAAINVYNAATCNATRVAGCGGNPATVLVGPSGAKIFGMAVNQRTATLYATAIGPGEGEGDQLYVINGITCAAQNTSGCANRPASTTVGLPAFAAIGVPAAPEGVAVNEATNTVYVADLENGEGFGAVSVVNGARCNATDISGCSTEAAPTVAAGFGTVGVAVDAKTNQIYATGIQDTSVSIIDGTMCNGATTAGCNHTPATAAIGDFPTALAVDHSAHTVYIVDNRGTTLSLVRTTEGPRRQTLSRGQADHTHAMTLAGDASPVRHH